MLDTAVILAGGRGSRLGHITYETPKPLVMVGDKPILFHLIGHLSKRGIKNFFILTGYLHSTVINFFDVHFYRGAKDDGNQDCTVFYDGALTYNVVYTGEDTLTGGRLKRVQSLLPETFLFTYGDGLSDVDFRNHLSIHEQHNALVTLTAVNPVPRFGQVSLGRAGRVTSFSEKPDVSSTRINGGFIIMSKPILRAYKFSDTTNLERDVFPLVAADGRMFACKHDGYWHCIDTERDLEKANEDYKNGLF